MPATALPYIGFDATTVAGKRYFATVSMAMALNLKLAGTIDGGVCAPQGNGALLTSLRAFADFYQAPKITNHRHLFSLGQEDDQVAVRITGIEPTLRRTGARLPNERD